MNTEPNTPDDEPAQPLVQWFPRGQALRSFSPDIVTVGVLTVGVFVVAAAAYAGVTLARRLLDHED